LCDTLRDEQQRCPEARDADLAIGALGRVHRLRARESVLRQWLDPQKEEKMPSDRPSTIAWEAAVRASALHAAGTHWREICRRTGMTEWQWKRVRQLYNATLRETRADIAPEAD
jgi:hypothetical protein